MIFYYFNWRKCQTKQRSPTGMIFYFNWRKCQNKTKESYWHDIFLFQLAKESAVFNFRNGQISKKGSKFRDSSILNFPFWNIKCELKIKMFKRGLKLLSVLRVLIIKILYSTCKIFAN